MRKESALLCIVQFPLIYDPFALVLLPPHPHAYLNIARIQKRLQNMKEKIIAKQEI